MIHWQRRFERFDIRTTLLHNVNRPKKYYLYIVYHKYPVVDIARIHKGFKFIGRISDRETQTDDFVWEQVSSGHLIW